MALIELVRVTKTYPLGGAVLRGFDLVARDGELLVLIGPSGSGKTTVLRIIAGLDKPDSGHVLIGGVDVTDLEPQQRDVAMVFQDNVLYPHRTVRGNIGFGLEVRGVPKQERKRRVDAEARVLEIESLLDSKPGRLSAGHQQLVQAAKAMVEVPEAFLLDEPLARLDAHKRVAMRREIRLLQQGYGVTAVYVTNDQEEAMSMADRVAVIEDGAVLQVGEPMDVYRRPASVYVAELLAPRPMNLLPASVRTAASGMTVLAMGEHEVPVWAPEVVERAKAAGSLLVGIRAEHLVLGGVPPAGAVTFAGVVDHSEYVGDRWLTHLSVPIEDGAARLVAVADRRTPDGGVVEVSLEPRRLHVFDRASGRALAHPL